MQNRIHYCWMEHINGKAEIKDLFTKPLFTSDIKIDMLVYEKDTLGNLVLQVNNNELNAFIAHITLKGHDNDLSRSTENIFQVKVKWIWTLN